jgi:Fe-S-cluster containining protein
MPAKKRKKKHGKLKITLENKCSFCVGSKCCNHVSQEIDAPRSMADFDQLLWQVSHPQVEIYKDEDGWFLMITDIPCQHLADSGACGIYEKRPMICREYSNEYCEFDEPAETDFDLHFKDYESLDNYCRKRFKKWDKRFKKWLKDA